MSVIEAIILGIVQGLTEFLPVSSSGHLQIAKEVLGVTLTDNLTFDMMLHVATVMATIAVLWREINGLAKGVLRDVSNGLKWIFGTVSTRNAATEARSRTAYGHTAMQNGEQETRFLEGNLRKGGSETGDFETKALNYEAGTGKENPEIKNLGTDAQNRDLKVLNTKATIKTARQSGQDLQKPRKSLKFNSETNYFLKLLISMIPVAVVGLLLRDQLNEILAAPYILLVVGIMLLVTAALLTFAGRAKERKKTDISWRDALIIGLAQAAAAMPGLSRSGTTIATGLVLGNKKAVAAQFSFLMIIIPILGEALLDIVRNAGDFVRPTGGLFGLRLSGTEALPYVLGFIAAFTVGALACKAMIEMVKRSKLIWFAVYCAIVGAATVIYYFI